MSIYRFMKWAVAFIVFALTVLPRVGLGQSFEEITQGLNNIGTQGVPGPVSSSSEDVVTIVAGDIDTRDNCLGQQMPYAPLALATEYESGRVICVGHDGFFTDDLYLYDNLSFGLNIVNWLDRTNGKKVLFDEGHSEFFGTWNNFDEELVSRGYNVNSIYSSVTYSTLSTYHVYIIGVAWNAFSTDELNAIFQFVQNGGGLFLIGLGWSWLAYNPGTTLDDFPMNQIASHFSMRFEDGCLEDETNNFDGHPLFHTFYPNIPEFDRAVRVLIDLSHEYTFLWDWFPNYYANPSLFEATRNLAALDPMDAPLDNYDMLIIEQATTDMSFSGEQVTRIKEYVSTGGGLYLVGKGWVWELFGYSGNYPLNELAQEFGIEFDMDYHALEPFVIQNHAITNGVNNFDNGDAIAGGLILSAGVESIIEDSNGKTIMAAVEFGNGKVVAIAEDQCISFARSNSILIYNTFAWASEGLIAQNLDQSIPQRIMPEMVLQEGTVTVYYPNSLSERIQFVTGNLPTICTELQELMEVDLLFDMTIIALATGGGGYSSGEEVGIGILAGDPFLIRVIAHELTHSWVLPGHPPSWFNESWASLAAIRVAKTYGGTIEADADAERADRKQGFETFDPTGTALDVLDFPGQNAQEQNAYTGKVMWMIETLEDLYGQDLLARYMYLKRTYPALNEDDYTDDELFYRFSLASGKDLFQWFDSLGTTVNPMPVLPVVFSTQPNDGDTDIYCTSNVTIRFNEPMSSSTLNTSTIVLTGSKSGTLPGEITYDESQNTVTFDPTHEFAGETVTVTLSNDIHDLDGLHLDGNGNGVAEDSPHDNYNWSFTTGSPLQITTSSLPNGSVGIPYNKLLSVQGGSPPYNWNIIEGSLPECLQMDSTGNISGVPCTSDTSDFTVQVQDSQLTAIVQSFSITIQEPRKSDVNGDGQVNVVDLVVAVNIILSVVEPTQTQISMADCNGDGILNILDVIGNVNVILGIGECEP